MSDALTSAGCCGSSSTSLQESSPVATATRGAADLPVVVVGAGPVGLAAAAHLAERGMAFLVLEAGAQVGASIAEWGHVRLFSPWRYDIDPGARRLLEAAGWAAPDPGLLPTGAELIAGYLSPLAGLPQLKPHLRVGVRVEAITRAGYDRLRTTGRDEAPFLLRVRDAGGQVEEVRARAVIDASGTWTTPNVLGATGLPAYGETEAAAWITAPLPDVLGTDRKRFAGRHTLVAGAGHSAATTLLALADLAEAEPGTRITWALRGAGASRTYGGGDADQLPARGALGSRLRRHVEAGRIELATGFFTHTLRPLAETAELGGIEVTGHGSDGTEQILTVDQVVAATGFRPDHTLTGELRLHLDPIMGTTPALAPLIDPDQHSCGTVPPHGEAELAHPETGYYAIGVKSYGRAPTFLLATGYEQARSVVAALAGDWDAARQVELELPETGVCSANLNPAPAGEKSGFATGINGGLLAQPLLVTTSQSSGGCCS
jgi:Pyridine nucleotide-disulphide oxidoreductase